ncbi:hypothetical protein C8J56DRAFT_981728 [Mycena floridula]|nr:hypothetical protein C8J56DRAFT_981728 [Mycena floridula]
MSSEDGSALLSTLNRVVSLTEELLIAHNELRHFLCELQPYDTVSEQASCLSESLISSLQSLSLSPEIELRVSPAAQANVSPMSVSPSRQPISHHALKYGPEIPTPQAIRTKVLDFAEGPLHVVTVGTAVGVFPTWALASPHVTGVSCNSHKAVPSRDAAVRYWTAAYDDTGPRPLIRIVVS